jgi:rod shape-determining protein MreB and related proteins
VSTGTEAQTGPTTRKRCGPSATRPGSGDRLLARDLAIDLGTANTLVYSRGEGIIVNEPTVIALNSRTSEVLAIGQEAWQMIGRTPGYIVAVRPLRGGAITDFEITERLIRMLFHRAGVSRFYRTRVLICVPSAITHVERRAVLEAARRAGAAQTFLIEQPMAAAIGASLPIHEPLGNMIVDVGGGTSEVAVISLGGIVSQEAVRVGGFDMDAAISAYVRREYGVAIGERTAEEIKLAIGSAFATGDQYRAEVRGRDLTTGTAKIIVLSPEEVREAVDEPLRAVTEMIVRALSQTPPELAQDLILQGVHLVGGGGLLRGMDQRISKETALPVHLVGEPLECVVHGAGRCLESFDSVKEMFMDGARA